MSAPVFLKLEAGWQRQTHIDPLSPKQRQPKLTHPLERARLGDRVDEADDVGAGEVGEEVGAGVGGGCEPERGKEGEGEVD